MNNLLSIVHETSFLIPIIILLAASILFSVLNLVFKIGFIPTFVTEIILGMILKQVFYNSSGDYAHTIEFIYTIGFILIMFISGFDNNLSAYSKDKVRTNAHHINMKRISILLLSLVYVCSLIVSLLFLKNYKNILGGIALLTITLSSTFAGVVVPLVKEEHFENTLLGNLIIYFSTISELISIVALTIFMFFMDINATRLLAYFGLAGLFLIAWLINKLLKKSSNKVREGMTHLPIRVVLMLLAGCVVLCEVAGGEYVLGAFLLGMFLKKIGFSEHAIEKIESFCFGLFTPIFFIIVGAKIDVRLFINNPKWILIVISLVACFVLTKLPLMYLHRWYNKKHTTIAISLVSCTLIVGLASSHLGVTHNIFSEGFGESIIAASVITCIITSVFYEINFPSSLKKIDTEENIILDNKSEEVGV